MTQSAKVDGRHLSRAKLEEIRIAAVKAVQAGQAPTAVAQEMGLYTNRVFVWPRATALVDGMRCVRRASGRPQRLTRAQLK